MDIFRRQSSFQHHGQATSNIFKVGALAVGDNGAPVLAETLRPARLLQLYTWIPVQ